MGEQPAAANTRKPLPPRLLGFSRKTWGKGFTYLRGRTHVLAGKEAVHCRDGCSALRERLQCTASEMGKTGTEIISPILDKR